MENENMGFSLGIPMDPIPTQEEKELLERYEKRKANAEEIEKVMIAVCKELSGRLEKEMQTMSNGDLIHVVGDLAVMTAALGTLDMYTAKPYIFGAGCA